MGNVTCELAVGSSYSELKCIFRNHTCASSQLWSGSQDYRMYLCHLAWVDQKRRHDIKCVLAEQFIQTENYYKKSIFSLHVATVYTSAKPQMAFRGDTNYINHA